VDGLDGVLKVVTGGAQGVGLALATDAIPQAAVAMTATARRDLAQPRGEL
jgi:NAD(P)-dependent dehydrogenase (short-subunit alcohol dehydrogenase family)